MGDGHRTDSERGAEVTGAEVASHQTVETKGFETDVNGKTWSVKRSRGAKLNEPWDLKVSVIGAFSMSVIDAFSFSSLPL